jgi:hypothetical protein
MQYPPAPDAQGTKTNFAPPRLSGHEEISRHIDSPASAVSVVHELPLDDDDFATSPPHPSRPQRHSDNVRFSIAGLKWMFRIANDLGRAASNRDEWNDAGAVSEVAPT